MAAPVKFDNPPVAEVVCGVMFNTLPKFRAVHVGVFWQRIRSDFPRAEEAPPINPVVEKTVSEGTPDVELELSVLPPLRRTWLLDRDGTHLIQIQQDRFLFNWKRVAGSQAYPSYNVVIEKFERTLADFVAFLKEENVGTLTFRQFELTYINIIGDKNGLREVGKSKMLVDHTRDTSRSRFLPEPETFAWNTSYQLPNGWGRLHMNAVTAGLRKSPERVVRLELTARGIPPNLPVENRRRWFDLGHDWITFGFADSTNSVLHQFWKRTS